MLNFRKCAILQIYLTKGKTLRNKIAILAFASLALGLIAAGCGGGGNDSSAGAEGSIDKATFVKQANEVCERASGKISAGVAAVAQRESQIGREKTGALIVSEAFIPSIESEIDEIRALGSPDEGMKEVQAFLEAAQKMIKKAEADPGGFLESTGPFEGAELAAARYGMSACPIAPTSPG